MPSLAGSGSCRCWVIEVVALQELSYLNVWALSGPQAGRKELVVFVVEWCSPVVPYIDSRL